MPTSSPIASQVADLEARIESQKAAVENAEAAVEAAEQKMLQAAAMYALRETTEATAYAAEKVYDQALRSLEGQRGAVRILEERLQALRDGESAITEKLRQAEQLRQSLDHHVSRLRGNVDALADTFEDASATNRQLVQIARDLQTLGYPEATALLADVPIPHRAAPLPLAMVVALAPEALRGAIAIARDSTIPGRMNRIVQSDAPDRFAQAQELSQRLAESDAILGALMPAPTDEANGTSGPLAANVVLGESGTLTPPGGIAHG